MQSIINVIDYDMNILEAISAPRMHHQWMPDSIISEQNGISADTLAIMKGYGHIFNETSGSVASATGIMIDDKGIRLGAIDPRSDGKAIGY